MPIYTLYKVIDNKRYDCRTAKLLLETDRNAGSFSYVHEALYRKKNGEYFLAGEGGPQSKYSVTVSANEWRGGEKITPLTEEEARTWVADHFDGNEYEALFGFADDDDDGNINVTFRLSSSVYAWLKNESSLRGISMRDIVDELLRREIASGGKKTSRS